MVEGLTVEDIWKGDVKGDVKGVKVNGAQNIGQGHPVKVPADCGVRTLIRSTMQGLMVVGLIVEEILNIDVKCVKGTGAQNIGQDHRVKIPAESVHLGEPLCKVLVARGLKLEEIWNVDVNYVKVTAAKI